MAESSGRLIAYGFGKPSINVAGRVIRITGKTPEDKLKFIDKQRARFTKEGKGTAFERALEEAANHHEVEIVRDQMMLTEYPKPLKSFTIIKESHHESIEPLYYWCLNQLRDTGFGKIHKITDIFTAAEHSSFYGAAAQRLGLAQDKAAQYLATIGKMTKDLFALVRELRIIDERLGYYNNGIKHWDPKKEPTPKKYVPNELALKGLWVDLVDGVVGGQRTGANIFTMAQQLQFTTLPDLFFTIHPRTADDITGMVEKEAKEFNEQVKHVLKRKLAQYIRWRDSTEQEMKSRQKFTLRYLRQHYNVIKMYMNWIKPYLKHIRRLRADTSKLSSPELIAAFEGSLVDIEVLARKMMGNNKKVYSCIIATFEYRTKPSMQFPGDGGYHRGPIHVGHTTIRWRCYAWTEEQIKNYIYMKDREDFELMASINESLQSAMEALGDDLFKYLKEAEEKIEEPEKEEEQQKPSYNIFEPFTEVGKGFIDVFKAILRPTFKTADRTAGPGLGGEIKTAEKWAKFFLWLNYNNFKKAHGMITW